MNLATEVLTNLNTKDMKLYRYRVTCTTLDLYQANCEVMAFTEQDARKKAKRKYISIEHINKVERLN